MGGSRARSRGIRDWPEADFERGCSQSDISERHPIQGVICIYLSSTITSSSAPHKVGPTSTTPSRCLIYLLSTFAFHLYLKRYWIVDRGTPGDLPRTTPGSAGNGSYGRSPDLSWKSVTLLLATLGRWDTSRRSRTQCFAMLHASRGGFQARNQRSISAPGHL